MQSDDADKRRTPKKTAAKRAAPKKSATKSKKADIVEKKEEVPVIVAPVQQEVKQDPLPDLQIPYEPLPPQEPEVIEKPIKEEVIDKEYTAPVGTSKDIFNNATKNIVPLALLLALTVGVWFAANKISMQKARQQPEQGIIVGSGLTIDSSGVLDTSKTQLTNEQIKSIVAQLAQEKYDSTIKAKKLNPSVEPKKEVYEKAIDYSNLDTSTKYMQVILAEYKKLIQQVNSKNDSTAR